MSLLDLPIVIRGAREHNLQAVDATLQRNELICFTGVSGSGKSSLAFDTIFAEGQRRYLESLSTYARQFIGQLPKPDVDFLSGLSPSISISQKSSGHNPRSTVGTMTEIQDFLRVLYARVGTGFCPDCDCPITAQTRDQIVGRIGQLSTEPVYLFMAPMIRGQKGEYRDLFEDLRKQGFNRARVDGQVIQLNEPPTLEKLLKHTIEVVVDRIQIDKSSRQRIAEAVDTCIRLGEGTMLVVPFDDASQEIVFSAHYACPKCGTSYPPPSPQLMSFNSPLGMCKACNGLGELYTMDPELLIPDDKKSLKQGAVVLFGKWTEMSRWQRISLQSVSNSLEPILEMKRGAMLTTPWRELPSNARELWLYGTGDQKITYTLRGGRNPKKFAAQFDGIIPQLVSAWNNFKNPMQKRQYEKYMHQLPCGICHGERLNKQARYVKLPSTMPITSPLAPGSTGERAGGKGAKPKKASAKSKTQRLAHRHAVDRASREGEAPAEPINILRLGRSLALPEWRSLPEVGKLALGEALNFFENLELTELQQKIAGEALKEIRSRLRFLLDVGLNYLSLDRTAPTLSGGESQRIRLASQIGAGLVGVTYVLDEPSIGLHPRDNDRLLSALKRLRDLGNTVIVVEHDEDTMHASDTLVDFGPGPGVRGGKLIAHGSADEIMSHQDSLTGQYMSGRLRVPTPNKRRKGNGKTLTLRGVSKNNLKDIDIDFPLGCLICVTGVSGSGKSSLITEVLTPLLLNQLNKAEQEATGYDSVKGVEHLDKIIDIDQSPIGRTPRSNPATYVKVFDEIRNLYSQLPEAKKRGYTPGRFSFNTEGGRCEACEGNGSNRLDMEMLADLWITCPVCNGRRYDHETLQVLFKGKSIADCLEMDIQDALIHFDAIPKIKEKLQTLHDVGLDYLKLGQPSPTLSGGEAQRIKLSKELSRRSTGKTLYVLDEPTTGLHFHDIAMLLQVLQSLVELGNTVIVVEHNLDLIQAADWIIDLGPEGGAAGGQIINIGTPEEIAKNTLSATGASLKKYFDSVQAKQKNLSAAKKPSTKTSSNQKKNQTVAKRERKVIGLSDLVVQGAETHNLQGIDLRLEHGLMSVFCGRSGSGKTSLAFDTIYAEGQRRYTESLSSYARQFVGQLPKPVVQKVEGLAPSIALEQRKLGHTPRSTVGTVTEIYDYLRVLMARLATIHCTRCDQPVETQTLDQIVDRVMTMPNKTRALILAPIEGDSGREIVVNDTFFADLQARGFVRIRINGKTTNIEERPEFSARVRYRVEVVVDRISIDSANRSRIAESIESALDLGKGTFKLAIADESRAEENWEIQTHSLTLACHQCGLSFQPLTPHSYSFNTSVGWCDDCDGLGKRHGTNPAALIDLSKSLREGGILLWPTLDQSLSREMLDAFAKANQIPLDQPIGSLSVKHRNAILFGTGEQSYSLPKFSFRFRGLYPALEVASRANPTARYKLEAYTAEVECISCRGSRLRSEAAKSRWKNLTIAEMVNMSLAELLDNIKQWTLDQREQKIASELIREIQSRLEFLVEIGLDYLSLGREANSLSGGEAQRIRLAAQLGSGLCGVLYVLDEPTIGLHPRDNHRLLKALHRLRDLGNSLIVVEHDRDVIAGSDRLFDFGPGSGVDGGRIVAEGTASQISKAKTSVTGPYLSHKKSIGIPSLRRDIPSLDGAGQGRLNSEAKKNEAAGNGWLSIRGAKANTLREIDVHLPLHCLVAVTGPSGSGKSSLINEILYPSLAKRLHRAQLQAGPHRQIDGWKQLDKVVRVDQSPLGSSPSSTPATYTGVFEFIRDFYSKLPDAKLRGYTARQFSFNVPGGRCEKCEGNGQRRIEMHFLPDVWVECDACLGKRFTEETLSVRYQGKNIYDVLEMKIAQARDLFINFPKMRRILNTLCDVGLDYLSLGQSAATLSGGEAQRIKLAAELSRPATGRTLYLLDEPTTGLHFDDIAKLLNVLHRLVDMGNTVIVIEHNLDVIKSCDWVIELGPDAGWNGGQLVFAGTPEAMVEYAKTAQANALQVDAREAKSGSISKSPRKKKTPLAPSSGKAVEDERSNLSNLIQSNLRCHTGEALTHVLAAGPYVDRPRYDPSIELAALPGDKTFAQLAKESRSPWQIDGRRWHLETGLDRKGKPVLWDRTMLQPLIDRIEASGCCGEIDWDSSSMVRVCAVVKSRGWFLHALTSESQWLKLKFRIPKGHFTKVELLEMFKLPPLSQLEGIQAYNRESRTYVDLAADWMELELRPHLRTELDHPVFWQWLDSALKAFKDATSDH